MAKTKETVPRKPRIGDLVLWYSGGDINQTPCVALVTDSQFGTLNLNVFGKNSAAALVRSGVRHVTHQILKENVHVARDSGGWDWTESARELHDLMDTLTG